MCNNSFDIENEYEVIESNIFIEDIGEVVSYGIKAISTKGKKIILRDISTDKSIVEGIVDVCKRNNVSFISLKDVIEDSLF